MFKIVKHFPEFPGNGQFQLFYDVHWNKVFTRLWNYLDAYVISKSMKMVSSVSFRFVFVLFNISKFQKGHPIYFVEA